MVSRVCLQFVIVVFPDHTHLLFLKYFLELLRAEIVNYETLCMKVIGNIKTVYKQ